MINDLERSNYAIFRFGYLLHYYVGFIFICRQLPSVSSFALFSQQCFQLFDDFRMLRADIMGLSRVIVEVEEHSLKLLGV